MAIRCRFQEADLKSALAATFLRKSPFTALKTVARNVLASGTSPCSMVIFPDVCRHRAAAFLGLFQTAKDLFYFYGLPEDDLILRQFAITDSTRVLNQSAHLRVGSTSPAERIFPVESLSNWIHEVMDDDIHRVESPESTKNNDTRGEACGSPNTREHREEIMSNIDRAMRDQDRLGEIGPRRELVQMAIAECNWEAAAGHILRITDIEKTRSSLPYLEARNTIGNKMLHDSPGQPLVPKEGNLRQQQFHAAQYGSVFLRLNDFEHAYFFFAHVRLLRVGNVHAPPNFCDTWEQIVDRLIDDIRSGIFILASPSVIVPKKGRQIPINSEQAEELDALMQVMIIRYVQDAPLKAATNFQESDRPKLHAMVKCPFQWKEPRIVAFCALGMVHRMLHFDDVVHNDPRAVEQSGLKTGWLHILSRNWIFRRWKTACRYRLWIQKVCTKGL